jgi:thiopurine S-methyltransferase
VELHSGAKGGLKMDASFWHNKWDKNQIGFHAAAVNGFLKAHFGALPVPVGGRVFVPLCGKTRDIGWLIAQGCHVVGAELSEAAIIQLFQDLGLVAEVTELGDITRYSGDGLTVFVGDVFNVTADMMGEIAAVYDRAALVALPAEIRGRYAEHVDRITAHSAQLVLTFEYDQDAMSGPPFSITPDMIEALYGARYDITLLEDAVLEGGFKGKIPAREKVWILR